MTVLSNVTHVIPVATHEPAAQLHNFATILRGKTPDSLFGVVEHTGKTVSYPPGKEEFLDITCARAYEPRQIAVKMDALPDGSVLMRYRSGETARINPDGSADSFAVNGKVNSLTEAQRSALQTDANALGRVVSMDVNRLMHAPGISRPAYKGD